MVRRMCAVLLAVVLMLSASALAEQAVRELSGYYDRDIAAAAAEIGELSYAAGDEFRDNYENDQMALRGRDGKVAVIELKAGIGPFTLCGVSAGMGRDEVKALFTGYPKLWEFAEEVGYTIVENKQDEIESLTLVVFFDESGRVDGAWYRNAEG